MILKEYRKKFIKTLTDLYPKTEIDSFFFLLIKEYLDFNRVDIVLKSDIKISKEKLDQLENATKRIQQEEPIQYILGKTEFYGLPFLVNKNVLIPRPETEELVECVILEVSKFKSLNKKNSINQNSESKQLTILDIGTGSGCIPITLKKLLPTIEITAIDISKEALIMANKNALLNKVDIDFIQQDILNIDKLHQQFDIIVSNPPYVRELEKKKLKNNVLENEPPLALFVKDNNPLVFYDKIADLAKNKLNKNGVLIFEINQYLGKETVVLLSTKGFRNIQLKKDMFGNDRIIRAYR
tara:strand:- start:1006 stop:1896 length:891 start_codon:yes stop_codon:yes gene_type:complete